MLSGPRRNGQGLPFHNISQAIIMSRQTRYERAVIECSTRDRKLTLGIFLYSHKSVSISLLRFEPVMFSQLWSNTIIITSIPTYGSKNDAKEKGRIQITRDSVCSISHAVATLPSCRRNMINMQQQQQQYLLALPS